MMKKQIYGLLGVLLMKYLLENIYLMSLINKKVLKEIQEALNTYHEAAKDGTITEEERDKIVKEMLDIASAGVKIFWRF